ncbi:MAG: carboxylating nicotinate-nucleotide diphosphorylase [Candidatus Hodarchaeales archaeon]
MLKELIRNDLVKFLQEDVPYWDITAEIIPDQEVHAKIIAKQSGIIAGIGVISILFEMMGIDAVFAVNDGDRVKELDNIASLNGNSRVLLQIERLCLNILGKMSGIATATDELVSLARKVNDKMIIAATRKTTPGFRLYEKLAVKTGGGDTHRFNLSDMVLIKNNHLRFYDNIAAAISEAKRTTSAYKKIEIEVRSIDEALEAARAGSDIIMLDNFTPQRISETMNALKDGGYENILIEASGNITPGSITEFAATGVNIISCGYITHSIKNFDVSMTILE